MGFASLRRTVGPHLCKLTEDTGGLLRWEPDRESRWRLLMGLSSVDQRFDDAVFAVFAAAFARGPPAVVLKWVGNRRGRDRRPRRLHGGDYRLL